MMAQWRGVFAGIISWCLVASLMGAVIGSAAAGFVWLLDAAIFKVRELPAEGLFLLPVGLVLASWIITRLTPPVPSHGTDQVIYAMRFNNAQVDYAGTPMRLLATILTIASGGSLGKEGPCVQIGASISSLISRWLRIDDVDRPKLVILGIAAGFSAVFGTPIAGSLFAAELLAVGRLEYGVLFPSFIAGVMAYQSSMFWGTHYFRSTVALPTRFTELFFAEILLVGVLCGLCALLFVYVIRGAKTLSQRLPLQAPWRGVVGGSLILLVMPVSGRYMGLGLRYIEPLLKGDFQAHWYDCFLKMYTTAMTMSFGGVGGDITPIFFIGSSLGSFIGPVLGLNPALIAALCAVGVLSGCTKTPIASSILAMELFGAEAGPYAAVVCTISFVLSGDKGVYPSQESSFNVLNSLSLRRRAASQQPSEPVEAGV